MQTHKQRVKAERQVFHACSWRKDAVSRLPLIHTAPESGPGAPTLIPQGLFLLPPPRLGSPPPSLSSPFSLLLCPPWEMLADLPPRQMKQAAAPQGRCRGQAMQGFMFFMSTVQERGYGRTAVEATPGCGNVCSKDPPLPPG